ncbi:hypothetical protein TN53_42670, partial [Streptomyces sp. WM6386]
MSTSKGLQANVLGTFDSIVMAVGGSAPAYSLAATTAVLVGTVGFAAPAALLYCSIPMFGTAWAFNYLVRTLGDRGLARAREDIAIGRWQGL